MKTIVQKITAGGIILNDGKVLIVQRAANDDVLPGLWEVPSGKKEPLEKIEETCRREVKEESGIDVEIIKPVSAFNFVVEKPDETRDVTQVTFLVKPVGSAEVKLSSEHQKFAWIKQNEIDNYNLSNETKDALRKAFENK